MLFRFAEVITIKTEAKMVSSPVSELNDSWWEEHKSELPAFITCLMEYLTSGKTQPNPHWKSFGAFYLLTSPSPREN